MYNYNQQDIKGSYDRKIPYRGNRIMNWLIYSDLGSFIFLLDVVKLYCIRKVNFIYWKYKNYQTIIVITCLFCFITVKCQVLAPCLIRLTLSLLECCYLSHQLLSLRIPYLLNFLHSFLPMRYFVTSKPIFFYSIKR